MPGFDDFVVFLPAVETSCWWVDAVWWFIYTRLDVWKMNYGIPLEQTTEIVWTNIEDNLTVIIYVKFPDKQVKDDLGRR